MTQRACTQPTGYVADSEGGDCNDNDGTIHPDATESCNNADDTCNGYVDEGSNSTAPIGSVTFYADTDGDTFGDANNTLVQCNPSTGYVNNADDCDDGNVDVHPNATEVCNSIDDNCDGALDDTTDPTVAPTWYLDSDGDGYGDASQTLIQCTMPSTHVANSSDCNDSDVTLNAGDQDSDGSTPPVTEIVTTMTLLPISVIPMVMEWTPVQVTAMMEMPPFT